MFTQLGRVLDAFDRLDLWKDTMLIVNTDHGFLLGGTYVATINFHNFLVL
jgi:arylsulfatase A-like enzyme